MLANPADFYMSMMSKESIEVELEAEGKSPAEIEELSEKMYEERIALFISTYQNSELRNDPIKMIQ